MDMPNFCFSLKRPLIFPAEIVQAANDNSPIKKYGKKDTTKFIQIDTKIEK